MAAYTKNMSETPEEIEMRHKLLEEFKSVSFSQGYCKWFDIFEKGVNEDMRRNVNQNSELILWEILNLSEVTSPVRLMDFGGGKGGPIQAVCRKMESLHKQMIISVVEPKKEYLDQYKVSIDRISNACLDITYCGQFQEYYGQSIDDLRAKRAYPQQLQDRALAVHVLYHLTSIFHDPYDPYEDMKQAVFAMYAILKPGGQMVIVMCNHADNLIGIAPLKCCEILSPEKVDNYKEIYQVWQKLLFSGAIADVINASFPIFKATFQQKKVVHHVVLPTLAEVGALASGTSFLGLCADQSPFDQRVVQFCMDYVKSDGYKHGLYLDRMDFDNNITYNCARQQCCVTTKGHGYQNFNMAADL
ncbi:uncharacterized protein LOC106177661 [Lingula anatina]|uniref:Uncharacterized protein LOC106177661 n=1 Tax=Lingula anatina TaxID=7574 RepID=A0A1S3JZZ2_LINAN|nr:uncharacterized protein LOC106177661 [Lingula anatina]|eukprot:XP_013415953.1 uncharacterized protein LOC106177661 [Lingula anatina]